MKKIYILILLSLSLGKLSAQFAANNFTLLSNISPEVGGGIKYSGCWGWTDTLNDREYGIAGSTTGTYFVDVTNPYSPTVSAFYPASSGTITGTGNWREIKTYKNYCYVMNDNGAGTLGLQIFDLSTLPTTVTLVYQSMNLFRRGHAGWIDGDKYYVAGITYSDNTTSSLDVYSLATPTAPVLLRKLKQDYPAITYVHDAFVRNDTVFASCGYQGLYIYRLTAANTFTQLGSLTTYPGSGYNHATCITPDGQNLVMLDEIPASLPIKVLDITNMSNIVVTATANQFPLTTPHNPWVVNDQYVFISAYQDGTQLWDISNPATPTLSGYFDTYPAGGGNNNVWPGGSTAYNGQWGLYPYFPSKNIFALDRNNGMFMINTALFANPEINIIGNSSNIPDGTTATSATNSTDFGSVIMTANATNNFVIQNTGLGSLNVSAITITGADASQFSIVGPVSPFTITPSGAQILNVKFTPTSAGTKTAMINIASNDYNEASYDFVVSGLGVLNVGLNNLNPTKFDLVVYPNPAHDNLTVKFNDLKDQDAKLTLINSLGQIVIEESLASDCCTKDLNVSGLSKGIYFLQVTGNSVREVKKIMVD
jgi:choice-of-anchor B domain-containing protein